MRSHALWSLSSLLVLVLLIAVASYLRAESTPRAPLFPNQTPGAAPLLAGEAPLLQGAYRCGGQSTVSDSGSTTMEACTNAANQAKAICQGDTGLACCFISSCQGCVAGGGGYSCWVNYTERIVIPTP